MAHENLRTIHFACACKNTGGSVQVLSSAFPLPLGFCHCNSCRHQTGLLAASCVEIPKTAQDFITYGSPRSYKVTDALIRYFCNNCGSNIFCDVKRTGHVSLCSGAISDGSIETRLDSHIFVPDTKDGGMSSWLPSIQSWEEFESESKPVDPRHPLAEASEIDTSRTDSELPAYCQCKKIEFKITRPNEESSRLRGPFADLLAPYVSSDPQLIQNKDDAKWWINRQGSKYLAGTCACNSCRTNSGFDIQVWAFVPKVNLFRTGGSPLDLETIQGLSEYNSSKGVHRHFCSTCGATVFWRCDSRPDLIDVSVGLLDADEGARAESWLQWWTDRISFEEDAQNKSLITSLKTGLKSWGDQEKAREENRKVS